MKRITGILTVIVPALFLGLGGVARSQEVAGPVPWVSDISGSDNSLYVKQSDTDWFEATVNTPIGEGDMVWQDSGGRSEIYLDNGTYIRLDAGSGVEFTTLSDNEIRLVLTKGQVVAGNGDAAPVLIDVPGQTLTLERGARAGVKVTESGATEVVGKSGRVYADGPRGRFRVDPGQALTADEYGENVKLGRGYGADAFDNWSDGRDAAMSAVNAPTTAVTYLPAPVAYDLSANGVWMNDPAYGWVWRPRVAVGWAPYRDGRWMFRPAWGWTWVSYERWGWYPYHYGNWVLAGSGWVWAPVRVKARWAPALVFWIEGPDYVAWQPLPWGVSLTMVVNLGPTRINRYIDHRCITVVRYSDFHRSHYDRYIRPWSGTCGNGCLVGNAPHRVVSRPVDVNYHRTPKDSGFVPRSRAPREQAVYAHHQTNTGRSRTEVAKVDYGSHTRPGAGDRNGRDVAGSTRPNPATKGMQGADNGRTGAARGNDNTHHDVTARNPAARPDPIVGRTERGNAKETNGRNTPANPGYGNNNSRQKPDAANGQQWRSRPNPIVGGNQGENNRPTTAYGNNGKRQRTDSPASGELRSRPNPIVSGNQGGLDKPAATDGNNGATQKARPATTNQNRPQNYNRTPPTGVNRPALGAGRVQPAVPTQPARRAMTPAAPTTRTAPPATRTAPPASVSRPAAPSRTPSAPAVNRSGSAGRSSAPSANRSSSSSSRSKPAGAGRSSSSGSGGGSNRSSRPR